MNPLRRTAAAMLLAAAIAPAAASAHSPGSHAAGCHAVAKGHFLGLGGGDSWSYPTQADCVMSQQIKAGTGVLRQGFNWADIERTPGAYTFSSYDTWVAVAARHNMQILPVLVNPPAFERKVQGIYMSPPASNAAFGRFASALVARYGPHGSFWAENRGVPKRPIRSWQIWNEPNLAQYWGGTPRAKEYAALLESAYTAVKHADHGAEVVTAGMPESLIKGAIPASKYIPQLYKARAAKYFDTLAVNPYAPNARGVIAAVNKTRKVMNKYKDRHGKMWVTEVGWGTGGPKSRFNIGSKAQAKQLKLLLKGLYKARKSLRLRGVVYYGWRDRAPYAPLYKDQWGLHTGLLSATGVPKLAYKVLSQLAPKLR